METNELREHAQYLLDKANDIDAGRELASYHWSGDPAYECYCTGCGKHLYECHSEYEIPFKDEAFCYSCSRTPEEKEQARTAQEDAQKQADIKKLKELREKYPND